MAGQQGTVCCSGYIFAAKDCHSLYETHKFGCMQPIRV